MATTSRDFNLEATANAALADGLIENSPSLMTAVAAMNNFAAEDIQYNSKAVTIVSNNTEPYYTYEDLQTILQTQRGVCKAYADLLASLTESVGIPTQVVDGYANSSWVTPPASDSNLADAHSWDAIWNGNSWVLMDPTFTDGTSTAHYQLTNKYETNTLALQETHLSSAATGPT